MSLLAEPPPAEKLPPNIPTPSECRKCWLKIGQREVELEHDHAGEWRWQLLAAGLCGALGVAGWLAPWPGLRLGCNLAAYLAGGWFPAGETWEKLREREIDVHFLMLAVAAGAAAIGRWSEGAVLLFLFSLAGALEHFAMERTQREIRSLFKEAPKSATLVDPDGSEREVAVDLLRPGVRIRVKPGALFPVDAEVLSGETAADESNLTGEATPVEKRRGDQTLAGTLNLWGAVEVKVLRAADDSALQKIIHLIRQAQRQKAPSQRFTDRFGSRYTLGILALTLAMFLVWWLALGRAPFVSSPGAPSAFYRAMTLLVVASPCALVLSIPSAILSAIAWGARRGILFRGGVAIEQLAEIEVVAMDKTGTLTTGELRVEAVESFPPGRQREVAGLAYALERLSTHPLARAVAKYGKREGLPDVALTDFASVTGQGLSARQGGEAVRLGRKDWVMEIHAETVSTGDAAFGISEVWLSRGGLAGRVRLRDDIRPESREIIEKMRRRGLHPIVLTGDRKASADYLRDQLGLEDVRSELNPEEKLAVIASLARAGRKTAMIGDGVNDAPGIAAAHVGVAMGARGADAALEQADIVLMHDRLENFVAAYDLSCRARRVIRQNLGIALGVIVVLVGCALAGRIPLPIGVLGHEGSTVIVVLNSLRLLLDDKNPRQRHNDKPVFQGS